MNHHQLMKLLNNKFSYNRTMLNGGKVKGDRKVRMVKENSEIEKMLNDIAHDLPFEVKGEYVSTQNAQIKY